MAAAYESGDGSFFSQPSVDSFLMKLSTSILHSHTDSKFPSYDGVGSVGSGYLRRLI